MAGENLPLVGRLLGHRRHRTTAGYAHLADAHLVEAAEKVGSIISTAMMRTLNEDEYRAIFPTVPFARNHTNKFRNKTAELQNGKSSSSIRV